MQILPEIPALLAAHEANLGKLPALGAVAGRTPTARLNPKLYTGRPKVSFMVK